MKTVLKIAAVLTWFNIIFWGLVVGLLLLGSLQQSNFAILAGVALLSAVPLNCYAALRLHSSIRNPRVPLSHQTPAGIRFVGFMALFFGISMLFTGAAIIHDPSTAATAWNEQMEQFPEALLQHPEFRHLPEYFYTILGGSFAVLGLFIGVNVVLNLRLLRWYYLIGKSDVS
jgi:hypothetical protein